MFFVFLTFAPDLGGETGRLAFPNVPFRTQKEAVLHCKTASVVNLLKVKRLLARCFQPFPMAIAACTIMSAAPSMPSRSVLSVRS